MAHRDPIQNNSRLFAFLERSIDIYGHEWHDLTRVSVLFLSLLFSTSLLSNYVDVVFLKRFGPEYIPVMFVIRGVIAIGYFHILRVCSREINDRIAIYWMLLTTGILSSLLYFVVRTPVCFVYPILYQLSQFLVTVLPVHLWNLAGEIFDARQSKRIFPVVAAAELLGGTFGSVFTPLFAALLGENSILLVFGTLSLGLGILLGSVKWMSDTSGARASENNRDNRGVIPLRRVLVLIKQYPVIRYLVATGVFFSIIAPILYYQFTVIANNTYKSEAQILAFLSYFRAATSVVSLLLLTFAGRLCSALGLVNGSFVLPINSALTFLALFKYSYIAVASSWTLRENDPLVLKKTDPLDAQIVARELG